MTCLSSPSDLRNLVPHHGYPTKDRTSEALVNLRSNLTMLSYFLQSHVWQRVRYFVASLIVIFLASPAFNWKATATSYPNTRSGNRRSRSCAASATAFACTLRAPSDISLRRSRAEPSSLSDDTCRMATKTSGWFLGERNRRKLRRRWSTGTFKQLSVATIPADGTDFAAVGMRNPNAGVTGNGTDPDDYLASAPIEVSQLFGTDA